MKQTHSIDELLAQYSNLNYGVSILIKGIIENKYSSLSEWDEFRKKDAKQNVNKQTKQSYNTETDCIEKQKPDFNKPVDIKAFLHNTFHVCGCSESKYVISDIKKFLLWASHDIEK